MTPSNRVSLKRLRNRSPWKSFVKESIVPDVPIHDYCGSPKGSLEKAKTSTKNGGPKKLSSRSSFSFMPRRTSMEKSVTWKDDKAPKKTENQTPAKRQSVDVQPSQMDELVCVLAELCDALEHNSMLMPTCRREASPEVYPLGSSSGQGRASDASKRSADPQKDSKQLTIRTEKVSRCLILNCNPRR